MTVRLRTINIMAFGQFEDLIIDFDSGFNLIYGNNESGKSTIASFIEGILYGFDEGVRVRKFNSKQKKYQPTGSYKYAGFAIFNKDGIDYRISRDFTNGDYEIYDLSLRKVVESQKSNLNHPGEFLLGLEYDLYKNLIASFQNQDTTEAARAKINELLISQGDYNFSANEAIALLDENLKAIGTERAYAKPYLKTKNEIANLEGDLSKLHALRMSYYNDFKEVDKNRADIRNKTEQLKDLRQKRDSYRSNVAYKNLEDEIKYKNELNRVNGELASLGPINSKSNSSDDKPTNKFNISLYIIIVAVLLFVSILTKNFILIPLAIIIPLPILLIFSKLTLTESTNKKYSNKDRDYDRYIELSYQKEKIEEILRVLANQDKTRDKSNMEEIASIDIRKVEEKIKNLETDLEILNSSNLDLEKKLASAEEKLAKEVLLVEKLDQLKEKLSQMETDREAIKLAITTIEEIQAENSSRGHDFEEQVTEIIRSISKDRYKNIHYDDKLEALIETSDGNFIGLDQLSTGFYDQMNFAMRFAISSDISNSFMIFDDAFINYDTDRLRQALFFLFDLTINRQVIYMTCHKREIEILSSEEIEFNLINLEEI